MFKTRKLLFLALLFASINIFATTVSNDSAYLERLKEELQAAEVEHEKIMAGSIGRAVTAAEDKSLKLANIKIKRLKEELSAAIEEHNMITAGKARRGPTANEIRNYQKSQRELENRNNQASLNAELKRKEEELAAARIENKMIASGSNSQRRGPTAKQYRDYIAEQVRRDKEVITNKDEMTLLMRQQEELAQARLEDKMIEQGKNSRRGPTAAEINEFNNRKEEKKEEPEEVIAETSTVVPVQKVEENEKPPTAEVIPPAKVDPVPEDKVETAENNEVKTVPAAQPTAEAPSTCFDVKSDIGIGVLNPKCIAKLGSFDEELKALKEGNNSTEIIGFMTKAISETAYKTVLNKQRIAELNIVFGNVESDEKDDHETAIERLNANECDSFDDLDSLNERQKEKLTKLCNRPICYYNVEDKQAGLLADINKELPTGENNNTEANWALKLVICEECKNYTPPVVEERPAREPAKEEDDDTPSTDSEDENKVVTPFTIPYQVVPFRPQFRPIPMNTNKVMWPGIVI